MKKLLFSVSILVVLLIIAGFITISKIAKQAERDTIEYIQEIDPTSVITRRNITPSLTHGIIVGYDLEGGDSSRAQWYLYPKQYHKVNLEK